jgi:hypothetical protein
VFEIPCQIGRRSAASGVYGPPAFEKRRGGAFRKSVGNYDVHIAMYNDPFDALTRTIMVQIARNIRLTRRDRVDRKGFPQTFPQFL